MPIIRKAINMVLGRDMPPTILTEEQVLAIAREAIGAPALDLEDLSVVEVKKRESGKITWMLGTQAASAGYYAEVDDETGTVLRSGEYGHHLRRADS
jgi:hypothetical protein